MADIRAGRCFSWLDEEGGEAASGEGLAASLPPPPADVAAAVDAELAPNAELADELQQVGGWYMAATALHLGRDACQPTHLPCTLHFSAGWRLDHKHPLLPQLFDVTTPACRPACSCLTAGGAGCWSGCSPTCCMLTAS